MELRKKNTLIFLFFTLFGLVPMSVIWYNGILMELTSGKLFVYLFTTGYLIVSGLLFTAHFSIYVGVFPKIYNLYNSDGTKKVSDRSVVLFYFISVFVNSFVFFKVFLYPADVKRTLIFWFSVFVCLCLVICTVLIPIKVMELKKKSFIDK